MPNVSRSAAAEEQGESRCVVFSLGVLSYRLFLASSNSTLDAVWKRDGFPLHTARLLAAAGTPNSLDLAPLIFPAIRTVRHTPATKLFRGGAAVLLGCLFGSGEPIRTWAVFNFETGTFRALQYLPTGKKDGST